MKRMLCIVVLLLAARLSGGADKSYLTGKVVQVQLSQTDESRIYVVSISQGASSFSVRLTEKPADKFEWKVGDPIEYRLDSDTIYIKRPSGGKFKILLARGPIVGDVDARNTPDLPFPTAQRQTIRAADQSPTAPRCAELTTNGPQFDLLANTCEFALSPRNLPNFVCQEAMQRATRRLPNGTWKDLDLIKMEVTFVDGRGDRYSNLSISGHRLDESPDIQELALAAIVNEDHSGGWWAGAEFGTALATIFDPAIDASFKSLGEVSLPSGLSSEFAFQFHSVKNSTLAVTAKGRIFHPGMSGSLWIDQKSGELVRVKSNVSEFAPDFPISYFSSSTNYEDIAISDIGSFLLPSGGEVVVCDHDARKCYRDVISFSDCKRFASKVRILVPGLETKPY